MCLALCDERTHSSEPDDPESLAVELDAFPLGPLPPSGDEGLVGLGNVPRLREQQGECVLGRRQDVRLRCVHDHHAETRRGLCVDVVETYAGATHHHELSSGFEHLGCHLGR
jgi:hypothetical protein